MAEKKDGKKQIPLRLSCSLFADISAWAEEDFRSLNGQIEYLLSEAVRTRKKSISKSPDKIEIERLKKELENAKAMLSQ